MDVKIIADSGSTKTEWCLLVNGKKKSVLSQGLSPYFLSGPQIASVIEKELPKSFITSKPTQVFFYGTGCSNASNSKMVKKAVESVFKEAIVTVDHDLMAAAKALCGHSKGIACILGTGSNSCYYNGKRIVKNSPGLGYVLGDEGSGAYLGKKVIQYYLYNTFEPDLMDLFNARYNTSAAEILTAVYKQPLPNRYLSNFVSFLVENRGHFMIENIIEDSFNDFFFNHVYKYSESWRMPINFVGSVAYGFKDVLKEMCNAYNLQLGKVIKHPMEGLISYHK
ncbi:MAG: N-acetylglucosamine kinase [Ferruginibacter sp.]